MLEKDRQTPQSETYEAPYSVVVELEDVIESSSRGSYWVDLPE